MSLVGCRLGPYDIASLLGAGGMGEVYKARDTRLDRTVAIKVIPADFASDSTAQQRFEREARAIAALSHPHICALFDVGHQDGVDFLVMEFLEGRTLAARLSEGAVPLIEGLEYGIEVADALAALHRAGIVHRDLKPGNIMITPSGAKLLDFGLAKLREQPALAGLSGLATQRPLTEAGTIVGTVQYMAPEQIEGKPIDSRADLFAFGAVLFEIMTGRRAFAGVNPPQVIASILRSDPPFGDASLPEALEHVIRRCLKKSPELRWQSAADLFEELRWIQDRERRFDPLHDARRSEQNQLPTPKSRKRRFFIQFTMGISLSMVLAIGLLPRIWVSPERPAASPRPQVIGGMVTTVPPQPELQAPAPDTVFRDEARNVAQQRKELVQALARVEQTRVPAPGDFKKIVANAARRLSESTLVFLGDSASRRWNLESSGEVRLASTGTLFILCQYRTNKSTTEFNVPLQIWSEDARAAEITPDGVVRFVKQTRSPAAFIVEPVGKSVRDVTTVRIRRAPPGTGWMAFKEGRLAIQRQPVTFRLQTIVPTGEKP